MSRYSGEFKMLTESFKTSSSSTSSFPTQKEGTSPEYEDDIEVLGYLKLFQEFEEKRSAEKVNSWFEKNFEMAEKHKMDGAGGHLEKKGKQCRVDVGAIVRTAGDANPLAQETWIPVIPGYGEIVLQPFLLRQNRIFSASKGYSNQIRFHIIEYCKNDVAGLNAFRQMMALGNENNYLARVCDSYTCPAGNFYLITSKTTSDLAALLSTLGRVLISETGNKFRRTVKQILECFQFVHSQRVGK